MAKIAFVVPPLTGHINPTLSLGGALIERGHEVVWVSLEESLEQHLPEGGSVFCLEHDHEEAENEENKRFIETIKKKAVFGIDSIKYLYEEVLVPLNLYVADKIAAFFDQFQPDLVINDHELFAGAIAAYKKSIPYATSITAPAAIKVMKELPKIHEWTENKIRDLQAACGLELEENITRSNLLNLIFTSHSFFGEDEALPEHYHFVGPVIRKRPGNVPFDWDSLNATRHPHKIFVSIGTTFDHSEKRDFFTKVVEAFAGEPVFVIVVSDPDLLESWPENFLVQPKVPQLELLPHLDAVVCHAGHNTVCETLNNGLPMVVLPIAYDQQHVAGRVAAIKAGIKLNFKRFKARNLKHSIQELLHDSTYRENAKVIRDSFKEAGGTARATVLLEELLIPSEVHE